jgi:replication factor C small subunit
MRIWNEEYRPKTLEGMILPPEHLQAFNNYLKDGLPNVIFYGSPGTGKTTTALILIKHLGSEFKRMNGSDTRGIDVVREEIKNFIQTKSFNLKPKIVFYDEAEALTPDAFKALKEMTERYQKRVSFIFATNHLYRFPEAIRSRCTLFEFKKPTKGETIQYLRNVLEAEKVRYSPEDLDAVYKSCAGDLRRSLNFLQRYSMSGKLELPQETYGEILKLIKSGSLTDLKRFFAGNSVDFDGLYRFLFERTDEPQKMILLGKAAYQSVFVIDQEINFCAFVAELQKLKNDR